MTSFSFSQVDVFASRPLDGNPVAVVHGATGIADEQMAAFARWTNLSETTFLLPPTKAAAEAGADYRLRIFTPAEELPFAGHPTLGSAHAWLEAGGVPATDGRVVQECGLGLIQLRRSGEGLAFRAPEFLRHGDVEEQVLARAIAALGVAPERVLRSSWIDNGPGWLGIQLASAADVLDLQPDFAAMSGLEIGVIGAHDGARSCRARRGPRGAGLLPRILDPGGPGDRKPERGVRAVAGARRATSPATSSRGRGPRWGATDACGSSPTKRATSGSVGRAGRSSRGP